MTDDIDELVLSLVKVFTKVSDYLVSTEEDNPNGQIPLSPPAGRYIEEVLAARNLGLKCSKLLLDRLELSQSMASAERDFTTKGKEGELKCPFASSGSSKPNGHSMTPPATKENSSSAVVDPITAEFRPDTISSPPQSTSESAAKCPIRFLDRHSPEEIAQYFENHKHEIPRSHEICVKRYQTNSESIRKLDAKYGSLVSMIQGLGHKHQPMLQTDEEELEVEHVANARVEKWAEDVSSKGDAETAEREDSKEQDREGHFERELKEVRVGESPSRPWGISVPITELPRVDFSSVREPRMRPNGTTSESRGAKSDKPKRCPFDPSALNNLRDEPSKPTRTDGRPVMLNPGETTKAPSMVFTGPVFIGYPVDEALQLLKGLKKKKNLYNFGLGSIKNFTMPDLLKEVTARNAIAAAGGPPTPVGSLFSNSEAIANSNSGLRPVKYSNNRRADRTPRPSNQPRKSTSRASSVSQTPTLDTGISDDAIEQISRRQSLRNISRKSNRAFWKHMEDDDGVIELNISLISRLRDEEIEALDGRLVRLIRDSDTGLAEGEESTQETKIRGPLIESMIVEFDSSAIPIIHHINCTEDWEERSDISLWLDSYRHVMGITRLKKHPRIVTERRDWNNVQVNGGEGDECPREQTVAFYSEPRKFDAPNCG
ncbi:MAG: hypothetical protein M1814_002710 [Vezdaea aestivalis]|nr:MAG: hypothetical protein M1814_002710 [Vezdaea aestivalis]